MIEVPVLQMLSIPHPLNRAIIEELGVRWVVLMSMDSFYKALTPEQREQAARGEYNFDHPGKSGLTFFPTMCSLLPFSTYRLVCPHRRNGL